MEKYGCVESGIVEFGDRLLPMTTGHSVGLWLYLYVLRKVCQKTCSKAFEEGCDLHFTGARTALDALPDAPPCAPTSTQKDPWISAYAHLQESLRTTIVSAD